MKTLGDLTKVLAMAASTLALSVATPAAADPIPAGWQASNMDVVGYSDLAGRHGTFKLAIKQSKGRWYLYNTHIWNPGFSITDVTDPADPKFIKFVPAPDPNVFGIQVTVNGDTMITSLEKPAAVWGFDEAKWKADNEGVQVWDISDPINPRLQSKWRTGADGTHRNSYPGGRYAYLAAGAPGFREAHLVILDISDRKNPKVAGRWWSEGQKDGEPTPDATSGFHGPPIYSADGKTLTMAYSGAIVNLDVSDPAKPRRIGELKLSPPFAALRTMTVHSVQSLGNGFVSANAEALPSGCGQTAQLFAGVVDNRDLSKPKLVSTLPIPTPPKGASYKSFCDKGGRFGPHNVNQETHSADVEPAGNLIYMTWFTAGLRVFDAADPYAPKEVAWFMPAKATKRAGPQPPEVLDFQSEDVLVDARGYIYVSDKHWGIHILKKNLSSSAQ